MRRHLLERRTRSLWVIPVLVLSLAACTAADVEPEEEPEPEAEARWLLARVPDGVDAESAIFETAFTGNGLRMKLPVWSEDDHAFLVKEPTDSDDSSGHEFGPPQYLQLLAYFPGYRVATFESEWRKLGSPTTWNIELERLPPAPVAGVLRDPDGAPVAGAEVEISYLLFELMAYFGYDDGSVPRLPLARATTGPAGGFEAAVPRLSEDPFFDAELSMVRIWVGGRPAKRLSLKELFESRIEVVVPTRSLIRRSK